MFSKSEAEHTEGEWQLAQGTGGTACLLAGSYRAGLVHALPARPLRMPAPAPLGRPPARLAGTLQGPAQSLSGDAGCQAAARQMAKQGVQHEV